MYDRLIRLCFFVSLVFTNPLQASDQLPEWFDPYPLSSLNNQASETALDYQLPLSQIARIQGLLRTQDERRLKGDLIRYTWQLSSGNTPQQGFDHVRDQLLRQGADILYECASRECGASNLWANQVFGYANLLGIDSTQFYLAAEIDTGHVAVYAVRRGNGRVFLHVDYIYSGPETAEATSRENIDSSWTQNLSEQGYVDLLGWSPSDPNTVQEILQILAQSSDLNLRIVVHQRVNSGDTGLTEANALAQMLENQLLEAGVEEKRIAVFGVGSLSPSVLQNEDSAITLIRIEG